MIKIQKDTSAVPDSLQIPIKEFFVGRNIPRKAKTTHLRRLELIEAQKYIDESAYNERYKIADTQKILRTIYNNKCAFCEQKVEQSHVEHYRPKHVYYWLSYSWDNLLLACPTCNTHKGTNFEVSGKPAVFINSQSTIKSIHLSSKEYDKVEKPMMVNPEVTDPLKYIVFDPNGMIRSDDERFAHTIEKCCIDRTYLNDERRSLLNIFKRDINSALAANPQPADQEAEIGVFIRKFLRDSEDSELPFLAFRRYAISDKWLNHIIKEVSDH